MNVKSRARIGAVVGTAALALGAMAAPASADPAPGNYRALAGVGSDTTQDVVNGLGTAVDSGALIASYNALGTATVKTRATGCQIARPNGSSALRSTRCATPSTTTPAVWTSRAPRAASRTPRPPT